MDLLQKATKLLIEEYGGYVAKETDTVDFPLGVDVAQSVLEVCIPFSHFASVDDIRQFARGLAAAGSLPLREGLDGSSGGGFRRTE